MDGEPPSNAELDDIEARACALRGSHVHREVARVLDDVLDVVGEVRRLRELILLAYPHVPETDITRDIVAALKREVDRCGGHRSSH